MEIQTVDFNIWPKGKFNADYAQFFIGNSYLSDVGGGVHNVTFEPGCRNNWHCFYPFLLFSCFFYPFFLLSKINFLNLQK